MKRKIVISLLLFLGFTSVWGNNIRITGKPRVVNIVGDTAIVELNLSWDNSWRDDFNWDAAWMFLKYKKRGLANPWQHAYLSSSGHVLNTLPGNEGGGYVYMPGASGTSVTGLYIMRDNVSDGNAKVRIQAKWPLSGTGLSKSDFGDDFNKVYVGVHAIEMVYVPYGAYYLGDAYSNKSFAVNDTAAVMIDSEAAVTFSAKDGMPNVSLSASYPKGYAGFYIMKYETSQEQYTEFLNSLTLDQQKARVANNDFANMQRGDYVFGDLKNPSCRNGIVFIEQRQPNTPAVFGNNLNPANDLFSSDDGQTLACNYMSVEDMIAYGSWCGLRPMSELEYEKACRRFYPQVPDKGEYAWNTNNDVNRLNGLGDLNNRGDQREEAIDIAKNVNSGTNNNINGPVRCGLFATAATNQTQAGATYWGVMEMSGNLKELCMSVGNPSFNGSSSGTGVYNAAYWNTSVSSYGVRGGGFNSADDLLRTSDRTEAMNYFTSVTQRDSTVGFRGVYSLSGIPIDGGEIRCNPNTICPEDEANILNIKAASCPNFPNMRFQYNWYVKKTGETEYKLIENAGGEFLTYEFENNTASTVTYQFKRIGICALGAAETETTVTVLIKTAITAQNLNVSNLYCNGIILSLTVQGSSLMYQWVKNGVNISGATAATYQKNPISTADNGSYFCKITGTCGNEISDTVSVIYHPIKDSTLTDTRDGKTYKVRRMPDGHWWMVEDLKFGTCNASVFAAYYKTSAVNQIAAGYYGVCIASSVVGAGYLYNWQAAMNHQNAVYNTAGNPSGNVNGNSPTQWQGICPDGWHLPSGGRMGEFVQLYASLCNIVDKIYPGVGVFEGVLGDEHGFGTYWCSTWYSSTGAYRLRFSSSIVGSQGYYDKYNGFAVRCVKNY